MVRRVYDVGAGIQALVRRKSRGSEEDTRNQIPLRDFTLSYGLPATWLSRLHRGLGS